MTREVCALSGRRPGPGCTQVKRPMLALPKEYAPWARQERLAIAPTVDSPLCPTEDAPHAIAIREPLARSRYLFDPETPRELAGVRLAAEVSPPTEDIVWLVDGEPVARVGYPHEVCWPLAPGTHTIRAAMARSAEQSQAVTVVVDD